MKLAFISDIHGNALALDAVLKDIKQQDVDHIYVLGDICYRGPEPQRSLDIIRGLQTDVIKGNADEWVVRGIKEGEVSEAVFNKMKQEQEWTVSKLNKNHIVYLQNLPTELHIKGHSVDIHAFHATPTSLFDVVHPNSSDEMLVEKLMQKESDIYIYGHIHQPYVRYVNGKCLINIGSVGLPFDGMDKASYGIVEIGQANFKVSLMRVDYEVEKVIDQLVKSDYPNKKVVVKMLEKASV